MKRQRQSSCTGDPTSFTDMCNTTQMFTTNYKGFYVRILRTITRVEVHPSYRTEGECNSVYMATAMINNHIFYGNADMWMEAEVLEGEVGNLTRIDSRVYRECTWPHKMRMHILRKTKQLIMPLEIGGPDLLANEIVGYRTQKTAPCYMPPVKVERGECPGHVDSSWNKY